MQEHYLVLVSTRTRPYPRILSSLISEWLRHQEVPVIRLVSIIDVVYPLSSKFSTLMSPLIISKNEGWHIVSVPKKQNQCYYAALKLELYVMLCFAFI